MRALVVLDCVLGGFGAFLVGEILGRCFARLRGSPIPLTPWAEIRRLRAMVEVDSVMLDGSMAMNEHLLRCLGAPVDEPETPAGGVQ